MKKRSSLLVLILLPCLVFGQMENYHYKRKIDGITKQWHQIVLPDDIFSRLNYNMTDMRIYGISGSDTVEAPYLLRVNKEKLQKTEVPFKILNQVRRGDRQFLTLRIPGKESINNILLDFAAANFDFLVKIEGSDDNSEWYEISNNNRVLSIKNGRTDYSFTDLDFYESQYEYYRLSFSADRSIKLQSATTFLLKKKGGANNQHETQYYAREDKKGKNTVIDVTLNKTLPVYKLRIKAADTFDYYRPLQIEYIADSTKFGEEVVYQYQHLFSGTLSSLESNQFSF